MRRLLMTGFVFVSMALTGNAANACANLPNICAMYAQQHQQTMDHFAAAQANQQASVQQAYMSGPPQPPPPDPTQLHMDRASTMVESMQLVVDNMAERQKLMQNPLYQRYENGGWEYFQDENQPVPGDFCSAFYWKRDGFVRLSGPGADFDGAIMTFWGQNIPRPETVQKVQVTLRQSNGGPPQTVEALNYFLPRDKYGAIAFLVPTMDALLDNILDVHGFDIAMNEQSVAKVDWTGGFAARDYLRQCYSQRRR